MRERWFGATGRRVPEIALDGELELGDALVLDASTTTRCARRTPQGRPVVVRAATAAEVKAALARPEVATRARHRSRAARPRPDRAHLWLSRSSRPTRSPPATSTPASGASRRSRSSSRSARSCPGRSRASAPSRRRRTRTHATARTGLALLRGGASAEEAVATLTDGRRRARLAPARCRRRARWQRDLHRLGVLRLGGRRDRAVLRRAGQHPRRPRDRRSARDDLRGDAGTAARGAADRLPRRGAGRGRRPARPAVGGAARRRAGRRVCRAERRARRPARRRPRAAGRRARAALRPARPAVRQDAARRVARRRRRARRRARRTLVTPRLRRRARRGARRLGGHGEPRGAASTASSRSTRSCCGSCGRDERRAATRSSRSTTSTGCRPRPGPRSCVRCAGGSASSPFGVNVWVGEREGDHVIEPHREPERPRGAVRRRCAARRGSRSATRRSTHPPARSCTRRRTPSARRRRRAGDDGARDGREGGQGVHAVAPGRTSTSPTRTCATARPSTGGQRCAQALERDPDAWQGALQRRLLRGARGRAGRGARASAAGASSWTPTRSSGTRPTTPTSTRSAPTRATQSSIA